MSKAPKYHNSTQNLTPRADIWNLWQGTWEKRMNVRHLSATTHHPMWLDFLNYLVHEECFNAEQLLNVIEKPWKWKSELTEYAEKGNCPSLQ